MGNSSSTPSTPEFKKIFTKYDEHEIHLLDNLFKSLASKSVGSTMDKATFIKFFNMPGILGERLFAVFDIKKNGVIDFEEFIAGMAEFCRGTMDQKIKLLFNIYDLTGDNCVSKDELKTVLYSLLTPAPDFFKSIENNIFEVQRGDSAGFNESVELIVKNVFEKCDINATGKLDLIGFKNYISQSPEIITLMECVLARHAWVHDKDDLSASTELPRKTSSSAYILEPFLKCPIVGCSWECNFCSDCGTSLVINGFLPMCSKCGLTIGKDGVFKFCMQCGASLTQFGSPIRKPLTIPDFTSPFLSIGSTSDKTEFSIRASSFSVELFEDAIINIEGYLSKKGKILGVFSTRFAILIVSNLQIEKKDDKPYIISFLEGCEISAEAVDNHHGYFGIVLKTFILQQSSSNKSTEVEVFTTFYARSESNRNAWIKELRLASKTVPFEEKYLLGPKIGKGRFSVVHACTYRETGEVFAVKIVEKSFLDERDAESLRTEIAILKLVNHPNIMRLREVFENHTNMYIVMKLVKGGDLSQRLKARKFYTEPSSKELLFSLIGAVEHLHTRGIVHRDIKPENILMYDKNDDTSILLSDFGLSKFSSTSEVMKVACGTLCYVAPEVLKMQGYSFPVDMWSIGVTAYVLLCGKLPFDGKNKDEIIDSTLLSKVSFDDAHWQANNISDDAKDLISNLLFKDPLKRFTPKQALYHPWFEQLRLKCRSPSFL